MSPHVNIHWIGIRKDSGRGSVWGYFTQVGKKDTPNSYWAPPEEKIPVCYEFWGSIGKKMHIRERDFTLDFVKEAQAKGKNYKEADPNKVMSRWGKVFEEEFSMHLMMLVMKG